MKKKQVKTPDNRNDAMNKLSHSLLARCRAGDVNKIRLEEEFCKNNPGAVFRIYDLEVSDIQTCYKFTLQKYAAECRSKV